MIFYLKNAGVSREAVGSEELKERPETRDQITLIDANFQTEMNSN